MVVSLGLIIPGFPTIESAPQTTTPHTHSSVSQDYSFVIDEPSTQTVVVSESSAVCDQITAHAITTSLLLYSGCELNLSIVANNPPTRLVVQDKINSPALVVANIPLIELTWQHVRPNIPLTFSFHLVDGLLSNIRLSFKKITRSDLKFKLTSYSYSRDFHQLNVLRC